WTSFRCDESDDACDDGQDTAGKVQVQDEGDNPEEDAKDSPGTVLAAVNEQACEEDRHAEDHADELTEHRPETRELDRIHGVDQDQQPGDEADEEGHEGEEALRRHGRMEDRGRLQPFSRPPRAQTPRGSPANSSAPHRIRNARKTSSNPRSRTNSRRASFVEGPLNATSVVPAAATRPRYKSPATGPLSGATTHGPISHVSAPGFPARKPRIEPRDSATKNVDGTSSARRSSK